MDYEDIIKLEEQSPIYSTGNNSNSIKHCMASFYDHDSEFDRRESNQQIILSQQSSFENVIDFVQNYIDIINTPLQDILNYLDRLECTEGLDRAILRKKILKRKNLLKRYRAKNRQPKIICYEQQFTSTLPNNGPQSEAEIKKKRNRVSAQVSRDRKKLYFKQLQQKNEKLQEEIIRTKLENEKLKRQMQDTPLRSKSNFFSDTLNNKLTRLLIFLGILCLIGMLKETFFSTSENLSKLKLSSKLQEMSQFGSSHHAKMIEEGQRKVAQFLQEPQLEQELIDHEERKVSFEVDSPSEDKKREIFSGLISRLTDMKSVYEMRNTEL